MEQLSPQVPENTPKPLLFFQKQLVLIAGAVLVLVISGVGVYFLKEGRLTPEKEDGVNQMSPEGWKTYRNEKFGFEISYPSNWSADNFDAKGECWFKDTYNPCVLNEMGFSAPDNSALVSVGQWACSAEHEWDWKYTTGSWSKQKCLGRLVLTLLFFDSYEHGKVYLEKVVDTFKFIPSTSSGQDEPQPDLDTTNWKTYRNEEYGFEFRHPSTFRREDESESAQFFTGNSTTCKIEGCLNDTNINVYFTRKAFADYYPLEGIGSYQTAFYSWKKYQYASMVYEDIYVLDQGTRFVAFAIPTNAEQDMQDFYKILNTFKFIKFIEPQVGIDTTSWKIWRNDGYGFSLRAPIEKDIHIKISDDGLGLDPGSFEFCLGVPDNCIFVTPIKKEKNEIFKNWIKDHLISTSDNVVNESMLMINGNPSIQFDTKGFVDLRYTLDYGESIRLGLKGGERFLVISGKNINAVARYYLAPEYGKYFFDLYSEMISSFQFTNN